MRARNARIGGRESAHKSAPKGFGQQHRVIQDAIFYALAGNSAVTNISHYSGEILFRDGNRSES